MKHLFTLLAACTLIFAACKKSETSNEGPYVANGITNLTVVADGNPAMLSVEIAMKDSVQQENVQVSVDNLPAQVTCDISVKGGIPKFITVLTFKAERLAVNGDYKPRLVITGASGKVKTYDLMLHLNAPSDAAGKIAGWYTIGGTCSSGGVCAIKKDAFTGGVIYFENLFPSTVSATMDTIKRTISIPQQDVEQGVEFSGAGTYNADFSKVTIRGQWRTSSNRDSCTTELSR